MVAGTLMVTVFPPVFLFSLEAGVGSAPVEVPAGGIAGGAAVGG